MNKNSVITGEIFDSVSIGDIQSYAEFEGCEFNSCNFDSADFSKMKFIDCRFSNCDLSMIQVTGTLFRGVEFISCKMLGIVFADCLNKLLEFSFEDSVLNYSSFNELEIQNTAFTGCKLTEVGFANADLTNSSFSDSDLTSAIFDHTQLEKADFSYASNYIIDPQRNSISQAKFSVYGLIGLLQDYNIEVV